MKQGSVIMYVLRLAVTLLLITGVVAAALAGVNSLTAPRIWVNKETKTQEAVQAVLPGVGMAVTAYPDETGMITGVWTSDAGYAIRVVPTGFNGGITLMVGVDREGKLLGISVISQTETAGLGAVISADSAAGREFRDQFVGLSGSLSVDKDGGQVDSITGATITSRAVIKGINAALECAAKLG